MDQSLYETYAALQKAGRKKEAKVALDAFIWTFADFSERSEWTWKYLATQKFGARIRHELFREVILPVLLEGYRRNDLWSLYWLASTLPDLPPPYDEIGRKGSVGLLQECFKLDSGSERVRSTLLYCLLRGFAYSAHEWPAGILWGKDGATAAECKEIFANIELARRLDAERNYAIQIDEYEQMVRDYRARLGPLTGQ
jgi:hypothetical protein